MSSTYNTIKMLITGLGFNEQIALIKDLEVLQKINLISSNSPFIISHKLYQQHKLCPHCKSINIINYGKYKDRQRYQCKECQRTFNDHTGTALHYLHKLEDIPLYLKEMSDVKSIRSIAKKIGCSVTKSFAWRHKFLKALDGIPRPQLDGGNRGIETDDTYILISHKGLKNIFNRIGRKRRKRGGKASKRGISADLATLLAACDDKGNMILELVGRGRLCKNNVHNTLNFPISKCKSNKKVFVTDSHNAYPSFAKRKNLVHKQINASKKIYVTTDGYNLGRVNNLHQRFKRFLIKFIGVATGYLAHYCAYFRVKEQIKGVKNKVQVLQKMVLSTVGVFLRYKDMRQLKMVDFL